MVWRIADFFGIAYDPDPQQGDPISIPRSEFDEACDELAAVGMPLRADRDQAWRDFDPAKMPNLERSPRVGSAKARPATAPANRGGQGRVSSIGSRGVPFGVATARRRSCRFFA